MGSAILIFQAIVIGLTMPISYVVFEVPKSTSITWSLALMVVCILAVGAVRRDRRTALATAALVQLLVLASAIWVPPMLFPGVLFAFVWALAIHLSVKTDAAIAARQEQATQTQ